jgi:hypothetical protein
MLQKYTVAGVSRVFLHNKMFDKGCRIFAGDNVFSEWVDGGYSEFSEFEDQCSYNIFRDFWGL